MVMVGAGNSNYIISAMIYDQGHFAQKRGEDREAPSVYLSTLPMFLSLFDPIHS